MIILDASVLIAHLDVTDALNDRAQVLLDSTAGQALAASVMTVAEILVGPTNAGTAEKAMAVLRQLGVANLGIDGDAVFRLAALRSTTGLRLPDCCVLLAAESEGAAVATFDKRLASAARAEGLNVLG